MTPAITAALFVLVAASVLEWCRDLFISCLPYVSIVKALLMWAGVMALGGGTTYAMARGLCDTDHCSAHMEEYGQMEGSGESCRTHCAVMD